MKPLSVKDIFDACIVCKELILNPCHVCTACSCTTCSTCFANWQLIEENCPGCRCECASSYTSMYNGNAKRAERANIGFICTHRKCQLRFLTQNDMQLHRQMCSKKILRCCEILQHAHQDQKVCTFVGTLQEIIEHAESMNGEASSSGDESDSGSDSDDSENEGKRRRRRNNKFQMRREEETKQFLMGNKNHWILHTFQIDAPLYYKHLEHLSSEEKRGSMHVHVVLYRDLVQDLTKFCVINLEPRRAASPGFAHVRFTTEGGRCEFRCEISNILTKLRPSVVLRDALEHNLQAQMDTEISVNVKVFQTI